jgi:hypothetical protein
MQLVRFKNAEGCATCTQTVNFATLRAIGMLKANDADDNSYFVRISFANGDTYLARDNMSLSQATDYRNLLESYWFGVDTNSSFGLGLDKCAIDA